MVWSQLGDYLMGRAPLVFCSYISPPRSRRFLKTDFTFLTFVYILSLWSYLERPKSDILVFLLWSTRIFLAARSLRLSIVWTLSWVGSGTSFLLLWQKVAFVPVNHAFGDEELHPLGDAIRKLVQVFWGQRFSCLATICGKKRRMNRKNRLDLLLEGKMLHLLRSWRRRTASCAAPSSGWAACRTSRTPWSAGTALRGRRG